MSGTLAHSTKASLKKRGQRWGKDGVQSRKIFLNYSFSVTADVIMESDFQMELLIVSIWLTASDMFGSISFLIKTLKVQCLVPSNITSEKNGLTIILSEKQFISRSSVHFKTACHCTPSFSFQVLAEKLIPVTIFWIFSSFFSMLDLTAQILSCWSLISCSSSASSTLRGSTARSVALQHMKEYRQTHNRQKKVINCLHAIIS